MDDKYFVKFDDLKHILRSTSDLLKFISRNGNEIERKIATQIYEHIKTQLAETTVKYKKENGK